RHGFEHFGADGGIGGGAGGAHRRHQAGVHRIAADTVLAELHGSGFGHGAHGALGRIVAHMHHRLADHAGDRRQVDDAAAAVLLHLPHGGGGAQEHAGAIHGYQAVPDAAFQQVVHRAAADAGVVHQDVQPAEFRDGGGDHRVPPGLIRHVQRHEL